MEDLITNEELHNIIENSDFLEEYSYNKKIQASQTAVSGLLIAYTLLIVLFAPFVFTTMGTWSVVITALILVAINVIVTNWAFSKLLK